MIDEALLKREEKAVFDLRSLYRKYGYLSYRMSKFEEYELYVRNKDFLVSDRVIAFNDTNGRLMALKPDVTLSIIKSGEDLPGQKQKVCYNENVYRVSDSTHRFKEIMQTGLECIGSIDLYDIYEVISLAAQSLSLIDDSFVLEISSLGVLSDVLKRVSNDADFIKEAIRCISEKNAHELKKLCENTAVGQDDYERLCLFITGYGDRDSVLRTLEQIGESQALADLRQLSEMLKLSPFSDRIRIDFSVVNDMNYYNGFVFKGFLNAICTGVLAGGQYDRMMSKMGRSSGAVGFALYLDLLEQLEQEQTAYDVDVLLLYDDTTDGMAVATKVNGLIATGLSVTAQRAEPEKVRYRKLMDLRGGKAEC